MVRWACVLLGLVTMACAADGDWLAQLLREPDAAARQALLIQHRDALGLGVVRGFCRSAERHEQTDVALHVFTVAGEVAELLDSAPARALVATLRGCRAVSDGRPAEAIADLDQAAELWRQPPADLPRQIALAWRALAAGDLGQPAAAWFGPATSDPADPLEIDLHHRAASPACLRAWAAHLRGRWDEDAQRWPEAQVWYERAAAQFAADAADRGVAAATDRAGLMAWYQSRLDQATRLYQQSLAAAQRLGDPLCLGRAWLGFAEIAGDKGDFAAQTAALDAAEPQFQRAGSATNLGRVAWVRAVARQHLGRHDEVEPLLAQAEGWYRQCEDAAMLANCAYTRGCNQLLLGDRAHAMATLDGAAARYRDSQDNLGLANVRLQQSHACQVVALYPRARELAQVALELYRGVNDRLGEANCLRALGRAAQSTGQADEAESLLRQALTLHIALGDPRGAADARTALGELLRHRPGAHDDAVELLLAAYEAYRKLGDQQDAGSPALTLGDICREVGDPKLSRDAYLRALECGEASGSRSLQAAAANRLGLWCEAIAPPDFRLAAEFHRTAIGQVEALRERAGGQEAQQSLLADYADYYAALVRVLLRLQQPAEAFAVAEEAHARTLLDLVCEAGVNLNAGLAVAQQAEEAALQAAVASSNLALARALAAPDTAATALAQRRAAVREARERWQAFGDQLRLVHPDLGRRRPARPVVAADLATVLPPDTALIEYQVGQQTTTVFTVLHRAKVTVTAATLDVGAAALAQQVESFRASLANPRRRYREKGAALATALVQPWLAGLPTGIRRLVLVPDGPLYELPFQALPLNQSEFLWDRYELSFALSASLLREVRQRPRPSAGGELLTFANPHFGGLPRAVGLDRSAPLTELPGTAVEAAALKQVFATCTSLEGAEASEGTAKRELGRFDRIHFATHGLLDSSSPLYSAIALAEPAAGSPEDGQLTAREILDLRLHADLVTLSACETGRGAVRAGEGLLGLAWALTAAGADTLVVSQWKVSDETTPQLMQSFYQGLRAGGGKAASLRAAAKALRADHEHPFYWAPFVAIGSW